MAASSSTKSRRACVVTQGLSAAEGTGVWAAVISAAFIANRVSDSPKIGKWRGEKRLQKLEQSSCLCCRRVMHAHDARKLKRPETAVAESNEVLARNEREMTAGQLLN